MNERPDALPLSDDLLALMRRAAQKSIDLQEPFVTSRVLLLTMLDDPALGPNLSKAIDRAKVLAAPAGGEQALRLADDSVADAGAPIARYDTIAFKTPDASSDAWLSADAFRIFSEGAYRAQGKYGAKDLALGFAAQAVHAPSALAALNVEPGALAEAIYRL